MSFVPLQGHKINKKRFGRYFLPSVRIRTKKQTNHKETKRKQTNRRNSKNRYFKAKGDATMAGQVNL
jgi:hypothetical protein